MPDLGRQALLREHQDRLCKGKGQDMKVRMLFEARIGAEPVYVIEDDRMEVIGKDQTDRLLGEYTQTARGIVIRLAPGWTASTLLHELLHACACSIGVKLTERDVLGLEFALGGLLHSSAPLSKALFEGLLSRPNPAIADLIDLPREPPDPPTPQFEAVLESMDHPNPLAMSQSGLED